jgi:uncharacterized hydantoinase/oxoprolinase family protein
MTGEDRMATIIGWDLGGANLKLARLEQGRVVHVAQIPCPIRQDRSKFDAALAEALPLCTSGAAHAVTMTAELSDVFSDRAEGVSYLVDMMAKPCSMAPGRAFSTASTPLSALPRWPLPIGMRARR